jgi:hypothetical protein
MQPPAAGECTTTGKGDGDRPPTCHGEPVTTGGKGVKEMNVSARLGVGLWSTVLLLLASVAGIVAGHL